MDEWPIDPAVDDLVRPRCAREIADPYRHIVEFNTGSAGRFGVRLITARNSLSPSRYNVLLCCDGLSRTVYSGNDTMTAVDIFMRHAWVFGARYWFEPLPVDETFGLLPLDLAVVLSAASENGSTVRIIPSLEKRILLVRCDPALPGLADQLRPVAKFLGMPNDGSLIAEITLVAEIAASGPRFAAGTTPPANPRPGEMFYRTDTGQMFVFVAGNGSTNSGWVASS